MIIPKVLGGKRKFTINMDIVRALVRLLRPFKFVIRIIQKGTEPSFHNVVVSILTLRAALESASSLADYERSCDDANHPESDLCDDDDDSCYESEGKRCVVSPTCLSRVRKYFRPSFLFESLFIVLSPRAFASAVHLARSNDP